MLTISASAALLDDPYAWSIRNEWNQKNMIIHPSHITCGFPVFTAFLAVRDPFDIALTAIHVTPKDNHFKFIQFGSSLITVSTSNPRRQSKIFGHQRILFYEITWISASALIAWSWCSQVCRRSATWCFSRCWIRRIDHPQSLQPQRGAIR